MSKAKNNNRPASSNTKSDSIANSPTDPGRRRLLRGAGLVGVAAVGSGASSNLIAAAQDDCESPAAIPPPVREAFEVLTAAESETLEAVCDCLIPSDANGPGAREARAAHYIDRALASHHSGKRHDYLLGLTALDDHARMQHGQNFAAIDRQSQEALILSMQNAELDGFPEGSTEFFNTLRTHTIEGTFCDPYYGGNRDFIGWDMLSYPGIRLSASEADVAAGSSLAPNHRSAYDNDSYTKSAEAVGNEGQVTDV